MLSPQQKRQIQPQSLSITQATTPQEIACIKYLFHEYTSSLNMDLSFQNYAAEVASLPGKYAPSEGGCLLLARSSSTLSASISNSPTTCNSASSATGKELERNEEEKKAIGCIALRALPSPSPSHSLPPSPSPSVPRNPTPYLSSSKDQKTCELKRLYVTPSSRSTGLGALLVQRAIHEAKTLGYTTIKLDTLPHMVGAIKLYERFGFRRMKEAYYDTPVQGTVFMEMRV